MKRDSASFTQLNPKIKKEEGVAFDSFLATLSQQLSNLKKINHDIYEENLIYTNNTNIATENFTTAHKHDTKHYINFLEELESIQKSSSELPTENKDITNISSQINEELKKFKLQLGRMALEGGGGTNAVQYANGGYMNGDLLVSGDITSMGRFMQDGNDLSGDISNLKTFIQNNSALWAGGGGTEQMTFAIDVVGDGITTDFTYPHGLDTSDLVANVVDKDTNAIVLATIIIDDTNISVEFIEPFTKTYRLIAMGATDAVQLGTLVSDSQKWNNTSNIVSSASSLWYTGGFSLITVSTSEFSQTNDYSHFLYDDDTAGSSINVTLLPPISHHGVKHHKKIGNSGSVILVPPPGVTIDGNSYYSIDSQYQSVNIYTDGINYFIQ
jgi:hypothetical protein